jgi:hypothetical protein
MLRVFSDIFPLPFVVGHDLEVGPLPTQFSEIHLRQDKPEGTFAASLLESFGTACP